MSSPAADHNRVEANAVFATTRWSVVLAAGLGSSAASQEAISHLCRTYWYPLYAFIRRSGNSPHDAEDLTQSFFAHLLHNKVLSAVEPGKGRFRSFLLASLRNFLANEWDRKNAVKRGGRHTIISLDDDRSEERYLQEPSHDATPEKLFEQAWALTTLGTVMQRLRKEYADAGKAELFDALQSQLIGAEEADSYAKLSAQLSMNEGAVRMTVLRMRRNLGHLLREEIAHTVGNAVEVEDELRHLIANAV